MSSQNHQAESPEPITVGRGPANGANEMKTAIALFVTGLVIGLVVPYLLQDVVSSADVQLPQLVWSKSPPQSFKIDVPGLFQVVGFVFVALAMLRFIHVRRVSGRRHDGD